MTGPIRVDAATLFAASNDARSTHAGVEAVRRRMNQVTLEAEGRWKGLAATGFVGVMNRWSDDVSIVLIALTDIADLLQKAGERHDLNDRAQNQSFNKYDVSLGPSTRM